MEQTWLEDRQCPHSPAGGTAVFKWLHPFTLWAVQRGEPLGTQGTLPGKEHPPAQSTSLHGSAFIERLVNLTNFEEKSSCPQAAETALLFAKQEGGCL